MKDKNVLSKYIPKKEEEIQFSVRLPKSYYKSVYRLSVELKISIKRVIEAIVVKHFTEKENDE